MIPVCNRTLEAKHNNKWLLHVVIGAKYFRTLSNISSFTCYNQNLSIWQSRSLFFTFFYCWVFVKWFSSWIYLKYCSLHDKQKSFKYCMFLYREIELLPISLHFLAVCLKILELPPLSHYTNINKIFLKFL
jgi:hypothetical protein